MVHGIVDAFAGKLADVAAGIRVGNPSATDVQMELLPVGPIRQDQRLLIDGRRWMPAMAA